MNIRASGMLLHITSLPSPYGIGDLGPFAYRFAGLLKELHQTYWQILPLSPTSTFIGNSPYSSYSAYAGNPLLISPDLLARSGLLSKEAIENPPVFSETRVLFDQVSAYKEGLLRQAYDTVKDKLLTDGEFVRFCKEQACWLDDFALFVTLKQRFGGAGWASWPEQYARRDPEALEQWQREAAQEIRYAKFIQYVFFRQWGALKAHANAAGVKFIGDMPIYVTYDSAEVWAYPQFFKLDAAYDPICVAGVPPDYFSKTGQRWGNPVYDWEAMRRDGFGWWIKRMRHNLQLYDAVRLDHFRGFAAYWEVPAEEETAINGTWVDAPGQELFSTLLRHFGSLPVIAEDLGLITADVHELKQNFGFPGMAVLQFGFGWDLPHSPHIVHNVEKCCAIYTGTHDNNTFNGWFFHDASDEDRQRFLRYAGTPEDAERVHEKCVRLAMMSVADTAIVPIQDVLGLGLEGRMNVPAEPDGNWSWRLAPGQLEYEPMAYLKALTQLYGRA